MTRTMQGGKDDEDDCGATRLGRWPGRAGEEDAVQDGKDDCGVARRGCWPCGAGEEEAYPCCSSWPGGAGEEDADSSWPGGASEEDAIREGQAARTGQRG